METAQEAVQRFGVKRNGLHVAVSLVLLIHVPVDKFSELRAMTNVVIALSSAAG